jgi:uncharacterized protein YhaN
MRLKRIEAIRYGGIDGLKVGDLGPGLNVVLGPNEAGKSSVVSLVRHVLYGFARGKDGGYEVEGGDRAGRLIFAEDGHEWAITRAGEKKGGVLAVDPLGGEPRPGLVDDLTHGTDARTYRVVFGFGIDDLQELDALRESPDDVIGRLLAVSAGLEVSPQQVRAKLAQDAEAIWAERRRKTQVAEALADLRERQGRLAELERAAADTATQGERLAEFESLVPETAAKLRAARVRFESLQLAARKIEEATVRAEEAERDLKAVDADVADLERRAGAIEPDQRVLDAEPAISSLLADLSLFKRDRVQIAEAETRAADKRRALDALLQREGWSLDQLASAARGEEAAATVELARTEIADLTGKLDAARQVAAHARATAPASTRAGAAAPLRIAGWAAVGLGVAAAAVGIALQQWIALAVGLLFAAFGIWVAMQPPAGRNATATGLVAAGPEEAEVDRLQTALDERLSGWRAWLAASGLPATGDEPAAIAAVLRKLEEARGLEREAFDEEARAATARAAAHEFAARVAAMVGLIGGGDVSVDTAEGYAESLRLALDAALTEKSDCGELVAQRGQAEQRREQLLAVAAAERAAISEALSTVGQTPTATLADVRALLAEAGETAEDVQARHAGLMEERGELKARVDAALRSDESERLRLEMEGLREAIARAADAYLVLSVACHLLSEAQLRYEADSQPKIAAAASRAFSAMTRGRYTQVVFPVGGGDLKVLESEGGEKPVAKLSRGRREQLYVAMRVGLLDSLDDVGESLPVLMDDVLVDFDPPSAQETAEVIADLAKRRQVVLLTCHPETVDRMRAADPALTLIAM